MMKSSVDKRYLIILLIIWALVHVVLFQVFGIRYLFDVKGYLDGADYLIKHGIIEDLQLVLYSFHIAIIAVANIFPKPVLVATTFQILLSGFSTYLLYRGVKQLSGSALSGFLSALIFLTWWDCIHWNTVLMTESLFCSLSIILIYHLICFDGTKKCLFRVAIVLLLILFTRPTGVVIAIGVLTYMLVYYRHRIVSLSKRIKVVSVVITVSIGIMAATLLFQKWDFTVDYKTGNIVTYMHTLKGTPRYAPSLQIPLDHNDISRDHALGILNMVDVMVNHPLYMLKNGVLKVFYLITFYRPYYTIQHNLVNALWLTVVYFLFTVGLLKTNHGPLKVFTWTVIVVNCLLIGISTVDWDNRFFIPMEPGIVLFAGIGAATAWLWIKRKAVLMKKWPHIQ